MNPPDDARVVLCVAEPEMLGSIANGLDQRLEQVETVRAPGAGDATDVLHDGAVDCVVSRQQLPDGVGTELLETVRDCDPEIPFVLVPEDGGHEVASEAISAGVTEYVPLDAAVDRPETLTERVETVLDGSGPEARADGSPQSVGHRDPDRTGEAARCVEELARRYEAVFENPLTLTGLLAPDGRLLDANRASLELIGASRSDVVGDPFPETPWWSHSERLQDRLRSWIDRAADGEYVRFEADHPTDDGGMATVDGFVNPVRDDDGTVRELVVAAQDVSARRRRTDAIEELHAVATDMTSAVDRDAVVDRTVEAAETVLDFDLCVISVAEDGKLVPVATSEGVTPDGVTPFAVDEGLAGQTYQRGESELVDDLNSHEAAEPQGPYESAVSVPIGEHGVFQAIASCPAAFDPIDLDLSEVLAAHAAAALDRIDHEREITAVREQMEHVLEVTESIAWTVDLETATLSAVHGPVEQLFGVDADPEIDLAEFLEVGVHPEDREQITELFGEMQADGRTEFRFEFRPYRESETDRWLEATGYRQSPDSSTVYGLTTDITTLKERERELRRQNERLEEFATVVSHDLRGPLNVAMGYLESLEADTDDPALAEIERSHEQMRALIDDILTLARGDEGSLDPEPIDFETMVDRCRNGLQAETLTVTVDETATLRADETRFRQLLENLLRNAAEHGDGADVVTAGVLSEGGFYVADDGCGIPADERDEVFEAGYSTAAAGTGFGLSIVERVADEHGWSVSVAESADGGARFEFRDVDVV